MRRIPLAGPAVRCGCLAADVILAALAALWLTTAFSWLAVTAAAAAALILGLYTVQVFRSAILVDPGSGTVTLRGLQNRREDLSSAELIYTQAVVLDGHTTRMLAAEGPGGQKLAVIPTLNGSGEKACERTARRLAEALGAQFCPMPDRSAVKKAPAMEPEPGAINYDEQDDMEP